MGDIPEEVIAEKEHVEKTLSILLGVLPKKDKSIVEITAIATFIHNCYNGIENILKQTIKNKNVPIPFSEHWHKTLLQIAVKESILSPSLSDHLYDFLAFRHFFVHGYGHRLNENQLMVLANEMESVWKQFLGEIELFYNK